MRVADSDCKGVGRVIRCRNFRKIEKQPDHCLDLGFFRTTVPDHGVLDLQRRILVNGQFVLRGDQQRDSSCMAQL